MKKVAIFINNLMGGGAERIVSYLLNEGHDKFEFHLILLHKAIAYDLPPEGAIKIVELTKTPQTRIATVLKMGSLSKQLREYLEKNKIETLFSLLNRFNLIACHVKKSGWKGKLIISERADTLAHYKTVRLGWLMVRLVRKYYPYADVVTAISKGIAESLGTLGIQNCVVIYNPLFKEKEIERVTSKRPFTFLNIARLESQKNQAVLLKAFSKISDKQTTLYILGIGPLEEKLKKLAETLGIHDRVHFEGFQKDVNSYLSRSDCFVFSSDYEGFGNVIIEALFAGLPVISTDCPSGPREILAPDTKPGRYMKHGIEYAPYGILTPVGDVDAMSEAMQHIIDNRDLIERYRIAGMTRAHDFDMKKTAAKYFELF